MYNDYFEFSDSPFENNLDQRFIFLSQDHNEVLAALLYFIKENKPFALLCGDVGTGKTMLINCFLDKLPQSVHPIIISNPTVDYQEILFCIAKKLAIKKEGKDVLEIIDEVKTALIKAASEEKQYVLIIDEAHLLPDQSLEHIRLLSNIETPVRKLLQILLVGQYELSQKLNTSEMRQLRQRISVNRFLSTLDPDENIQYIDHRLRVVGSNFEACFEADSKRLLCKLSKGFPRLTNQICDNAFLVCKAEGLNKVTKSVLKKADEAIRSDLIFTPKSLGIAARYIPGFNDGFKNLPVFVTSCIVFILLAGAACYTFYFANKKQKLLPIQSQNPVTAEKLAFDKSPGTDKKKAASTVFNVETILSDKQAQPELHKDEHSVKSAVINKTFDNFTKKPAATILSSFSVQPKGSEQSSKSDNKTSPMLTISDYPKSYVAEIPAESMKLEVETNHLSKSQKVKSKGRGIDSLKKETKDIKEKEVFFDFLNSGISIRQQQDKKTAEAETKLIIAARKQLPAKTAKKNSIQPPLQNSIIVKEGDSLTEIARKYYLDQMSAGIAAIILANPKITNRDLIYPEQKLFLPSIDSDSKKEFYLQDNLHYMVYDSCSSQKKLQGAMLFLVQEKIKFIVESNAGDNSTDTYKIILGGYKKAEDLNKAIKYVVGKTGMR